MIESKKLAYILRHHPEEYGLTHDEFGYIGVKELLSVTHWNMEDLEEVVTNNTRFLFNKDKTKIKAAHGHSYPVLAENEQVPPEFLYHGTAKRFLENINKNGLKPMSRTYVHLSETVEVARLIGMRHGEPVILKINTKDLYKDGWKFNKSEDGVWLTTEIPPKYFHILY